MKRKVLWEDICDRGAIKILIIAKIEKFIIKNLQTSEIFVFCQKIIINIPKIFIFFISFQLYFNLFYINLFIIQYISNNFCTQI